MERISIDDARLAARQIGRPLRGAVAVARRCECGFPQVLLVAPCVDGAPFPTLYWLSCPHLVREVAALEAVGWIGRLERRLTEDVELRARLDVAHDGYVAERLRLLREAPDARMAAGLQKVLAARGIGGIADRSRLKCLHLHVAHALARENPIGELVLDMLVERECGREKAICSSLAGEEQITDQPTRGR